MLLTRSRLREIVRKYINENLEDMDYCEDSRLFVVCDGDSCHIAQGCDLEWELEKGGEVVAGPFNATESSKVFRTVDRLNAERNLNESNDIYTDQWEEEKEMFFNAINDGSAMVEDDMVWTYYPGTENSNDPRFIYYKAGDDCLTDDHFCKQHSPQLDLSELKDIQYYAKREGVNLSIPEGLYFDEENYDEEED